MCKIYFCSTTGRKLFMKYIMCECVTRFPDIRLMIFQVSYFQRVVILSLISHGNFMSVLVKKRRHITVRPLDSE